MADPATLLGLGTTMTCLPYLYPSGSIYIDVLSDIAPPCCLQHRLSLSVYRILKKIHSARGDDVLKARYSLVYCGLLYNATCRFVQLHSRRAPIILTVLKEALNANNLLSWYAI